MLQRHHLIFRQTLLQSMRRRSFSDDPSKTFRDKGMAEENRYFMQKQAEEIKRLRKQFQLLTKYQEKLESKLHQTEKTLENMGKDIEKEEK